MTKRYIEDGGEWWHIVPLDDLMVHHRSGDCPCNPIRNPEDDRVWIHNAFDGRDFIEEEDDGSKERHYWGPH